MLYSAPLFVAMARGAARAAQVAHCPRRLAALVWLGCIGYWWRACRLHGLSTHGLAGALVRSCTDHRRAAFRTDLHQPITAAPWRAGSSYAGIASSSGGPAVRGTRRDAARRRTGVRRATPLCALLVQRRRYRALGSSGHRVAMLASTVFVVAQFVLTRRVGARGAGSIHAISLARPSSRVLRRGDRDRFAHGANAASLVGSFGPVFTIGSAP